MIKPIQRSQQNQRKPTKTISGVTPVAVVIKPRACAHGTCVYCPTLNVPQSYTPKSPAIMRAMSLAYDPYKQVVARVGAFEAMKHPTDKIELIIMGGTFLSYPEKYQYEFIKSCYDALNSKKNLDNKYKDESEKLSVAQKSAKFDNIINLRGDISRIKINRDLTFENKEQLLSKNSLISLKELMRLQSTDALLCASRLGQMFALIKISKGCWNLDVQELSWACRLLMTRFTRKIKEDIL